MAAENLGELTGNFKLTTDTSAVEHELANFTATAKRQLESLGGGTLTQLTDNFKGFSNTVVGGLDAINAGIARVQNIASLGFLGVGLGNFVKQVFQTRSYFQDAASSMKTFLGDAEKGAKFTKELQDYAFYNMYEFQDLVGASKQLIAYGTTEGKEIITVIDQLSNIATGTGADLNSMIDIYNKVKASGSANGIVLDQLASRGLLVKQTLQEMGETVNGNKVTFEQFQKVLKHVTDDGGMFHDLMKDQLNNLSASSAQLSDNLTAMYNEIGEKAEPYMKEAIDLAGLIVENYQEVAAVLFDIAKAYGIYKVAASAIEWNKNSQEEEHIKRLAEEKVALEEAAEATKTLKNEDLQTEVAKNKLTQAEADQIAKLRDQVQEENKMRISKGNLTQEQAKELAIIKEGLLRREQELKKIKDQAAEEVKAKEKEIAAIEKKIAKQKEEVETAKSFGNEGKFIAEAEEKKLNALETEKQTLETQKYTAQKRAEEAEVQKNTIATARETAAKTANAQTSSVWSRGLTAAGSALKGIGSSIVEMINPTGLAIAAIGFLCTKLYDLYEAGSFAEQAQNRLAEAQNAADEEVNKEMQSFAEYSNVIKKTTSETEEYSKKLKGLKEGTKEYEDTQRRSEAATKMLSEAKAGLLDMTKKYNIETTETINGITKEMSAIDLVTKKYDEYKDKIREVANFKAYQSFIQGEKDNIQAQVADIQKYLRSDMYSVLLKGLKGDERGAKIAEINKAISDIGLNMMEGKKLIGGDAKLLYDEYVEKIGGLDAVWKAVKSGALRIGNVVSGDLTWDEAHQYEEGKSFIEQGKGYAAYLMDMAQRSIDESNNAILHAKQAFGITDEQLLDKEEDDKKGKGKDTTKTAIKKAKDDAKKYIEEYAKIMDDLRKEKRKIDTDASLDDEERAAKRTKLELDKQLEFDKLEAKTDFLSEEKRKSLREKYEYAATEEYDIAYEEYLKKQKDIARLQNEAANLQLTGDKDKNGNAVDTQKNLQAYNAKIAQIGELTAELEGYNEVITKYREWEVNYSRIRKITKEQNDKFVVDEIKKQQQLTETYKNLRREIMILYDDGQLTDEQYRNLSFQLDINEERERQQEYINIYGGYYVKREQLMREWEQRLANVPPEYFNVAKQKMVEELSKMDFSQFKENLNWDAIFGDLSHQSARAIKENIDRLKAAFEAEKGNMGIDEIKTVTEALTKLDNELNKRNPWRAMVQSIKAMKAAAKELPQLTEKHTQAQKDLNEATAEYKRISEELKTLQQQLSNPNLSGEQRTKIQTEINKKIKEQGKALANVTEKEKEAAQAQKDLNEEQDKANKAPNEWIQGWKDVSKGIADAGDALAQFDGKLGEIGSVLANIGNELQNAFSSIQSGDMYSIVSTAVTNIVGIVSTISNSRKKARQEEKEWALAQQRFADNMQLAEVQSARLATKNKENIFGVRDYMGEAQDAVDAYKLAQKKLLEQITKLDKEGKAKKGQRDGVDWGAVGKTTGKGAAAGAAIGTAIGGWALGLGTVIGAGIGAVGGFISGLFGGKKKKTQWGGLLEQYPELVERAADGEERINMELAEQLIQQGIVNDETKEMLETAKGYQEEMDAANEQISSIVSDLTGSLGQNLKNALVDAFVAGEDAAETFKKSVDTMLEDMIADLMFTAAFSDLFDELGEKYKAIFKGGGTIEDIVNATNEFMDEGAARSQLYVDGLSAVQKAANENGGHNLWQSAQERNAVSGGITNVTQDTAEEMNGRLTQIQSHTFAICENMKSMVQMQQTQLTILQGIHTDTGQLHAIRADIEVLKTSVSDIQIKGIKLKN